MNTINVTVQQKTKSNKLRKYCKKDKFIFLNEVSSIL